MKKRILALFLSVLMLLSAAPISPVFAIENEPLDNASLYTALLNAQTLDEFSALLNANLTDEASAQSFLEAFGEEELTDLVIKSEELKANYVKPDATVDFTDAAPLMDATAKKKAPLKAPAKGPAKSAPLSKDVDGLETFKTVVDNKDGTYSIKLEAYTTGEVKTETKVMPSDIVLVLDQSGSMGDSFKAVQTDGYRRVYTYNNALLSMAQDLYVLLPNNTYSPVSVTYHWTIIDGYYEYEWRDEYGRAHSEDSYGTLLGCPEELQGNLYRYYTTSSTISRKEALTDAANAFLTYVQEQAETNNVDHRVAIVGFADEKSYYSNNYNNTELLSTSSVVNYGSATAQNYKDALVSANVSGNINSRLTEAVSRLDANGGTYINYGVEMAHQIFNNASATDSNGNPRNRVVIVLTDGTPGSGSWGGTVENQSCAKDALSRASALKDDGVTIYTIGIFEGADATSAGSNNGNDTQKNNYFLQHLSSNNGTPRNPSYYLSASDGESLTLIFQSVSNQIGIPSISLGTSTVIRDAVTQYFEIPEGATVSLYTADCNGYNETDGYTFGTTLTPYIGDVTIENNMVDIAGFHFDDNFCAKNPDNTYRGKKLIVEFTVTPKEGFLGGNGVPTNDQDNSGVYVKDGDNLTLVENFVADKTVDVPIPSFTIDVQDKNVYLLGGVDDDEMMTGMTIKFGEEEAQDFKTWYNGLEDWQQAYVEFECPDETDAKTGLTADTTYTATVTIAPSNTGTEMAKSDDDTANIYVYKPTVTFKDTTENAGTKLTNENLYQKNYVSIKWLHDTTEASSMGTAPTLSFTFDKNGTTLTADVNVKASVKIGDTDVTSYTTFAWTANSGSVCCTSECTAAPTGAHFRVHVANTDLTITKSGMDENETTIYTVTGDGKTITVAIKGNSSVTIKDLRVGVEYTVTEQSDWSWRYTADKESETIKLVADATENEVEFENEKTKTTWLDAFDYVKNLFKKPTSTNN